MKLHAAVLLIATAALPAALASGPLHPGAELFRRAWSAADGLGPTFNAHSCAACHDAQDEQAFVLVSAGIVDPTGGRVFARLRVTQLGSFEHRSAPAGSSRRRPPRLEGLGLIEQIPAAAIAAWADPDDRDGDGISGRVPAGRFGWKARMPSLTLAVAAAFATELGLSSEYFPDAVGPVLSRDPELKHEQIAAVVDYFRSRPAPRPGARTSDPSGAILFDTKGCAACHRPAFVLSDHGRDRRVSAYTDLLLHDMGAALADGVQEGTANGREFRTAPLWGLTSQGPPYLHDGRALTLEDAIRAHGGEAASSQQAYERLRPEERRLLLEFLSSL